MQIFSCFPRRCDISSRRWSSRYADQHRLIRWDRDKNHLEYVISLSFRQLVRAWGICKVSISGILPSRRDKLELTAVDSVSLIKRFMQKCRAWCAITWRAWQRHSLLPDFMWARVRAFAYKQGATRDVHEVQTPIAFHVLQSSIAFLTMTFSQSYNDIDRHLL